MNNYRSLAKPGADPAQWTREGVASADDSMRESHHLWITAGLEPENADSVFGQKESLLCLVQT